MSGLRGLILTVRFLCELAMLAALAYWGFAVGDGVSAWLLGLGAPLLAAIVWGALVAPKARWPLPLPARVVVEVLLFGVDGAHRNSPLLLTEIPQVSGPVAMPV